jgi:hypothetical protein
VEVSVTLERTRRRLASEAEHFASAIENGINDLRRRVDALLKNGIRPAGSIALADLPSEATVRCGHSGRNGRLVLTGVALNLLGDDHPLRDRLAGITPVTSPLGPVIWCVCHRPDEHPRQFVSLGEVIALTAAVREGLQ